MNAKEELNPGNRQYLLSLRTYVMNAYLHDLVDGDITTRLFLRNRGLKIEAEIVAKQEGILAGMQEAEWFLKQVKIELLNAKKDGASLKAGDKILRIKGRADSILAAERTLLNLLQRMSGVATATKRMKEKLPKGVRLLATRKTLWGLLDKRAVTVGGGETHRLNLSDAVLIKENHLMLIDKLEKRLKRVFRKSKKTRFVEIEVESIAEADEFLAIYEKFKTKYPRKVVIMLDNFKPSDIALVAPKLHKAGLIVEVSGGIGEKNAVKYCAKGVSAVSSSAITTKADSLDISLNILK
jgi:nicotinate-nucleotide pyrophosphorylase (carboxylating)